VVEQTAGRLSRRGPAVDRSGQRPGNRQFADAVYETLVDFSDQRQLTLELAYYPPYHSKYNRVERCWGILENHWNGALLDSIPDTLEWAKTMRWCGVRPKVHLLERDYPTGVRIAPRLFLPIAARLHRSALLPKWSLVIYPRPR